MANFLTRRKFNQAEGIHFVDSNEYFYNRRKFNTPEGVYFVDADEYFYNRRKFNELPVGETFTLLEINEEQSRRDWFFRNRRSIA